MTYREPTLPVSLVYARQSPKIRPMLQSHDQTQYDRGGHGRQCSIGLGDIGPEAAMPVMEGKAVLFKQFAGVDAWPVALDTNDTEEIIAICKALAPAYGGINLEDISAPRCFEIESRLRDELDIPVFHDDQHGTAIVTQAALINALKVVSKDIADVRIVVSGVGAAGTAIIKLLIASGARHILAAGRNGVIERGSTHADEHRQWLAEHTNQRALPVR